MSTAIESALRFWAADGERRLRPDTKEARNAVGYCVRRLARPARRVRGARMPVFHYDVFAPGPVRIGVEPGITWAMRLADVDYCTRGRLRRPAAGGARRRT